MTLAITVPDFLNPFRDPLAWDSIEIDGFEIGPRNGEIRAIVEEADLKNEWDRKKGKGVKGETSTLTQQPAIDVVVNFEIWGTTGVELWHRLVYKFRHHVGPNLTKVFAIEHPRLLQVGVSSVCLDHIIPLRANRGGLHTAGFKCHQFFPPPPVSITSTPTGTTPDPGAIPGVPTDPAVIAAQKGFDAALKDAKDLGAP